jgi:hypothetical protein
LPTNEIKIKLIIDGKEANAAIDLTDENVKELYKSFKYGKQDVTDLTTSISQGFNNAREIIQGVKEVWGTLQQNFGESIKAYQEQEVALVKLNTALKQSGQFTKENSDILVEYAAELQATTIYGDEVTESSMAMLLAMGLTVEQTKEATLQAANLATIMGTDLSGATRVMGDLFAGDATMIKRYVKGLDETVLKSGDLNKVLEMLNKSIGGQAIAMGESSTGAMAKMNNAIGDMRENIGELLDYGLRPLSSAIASLVGALNQLSPVLSGVIGLFISLGAVAVTLRVTGLMGIATTIYNSLIPSIAALGKSIIALEFSLGPVGWLILGLTAAAYAIYLMTGNINENATAVINHRKTVDKSYPNWDKSGFGARNIADEISDKKGESTNWLKVHLDNLNAADKVVAGMGMTVTQVKEKIKELQEAEGLLIAGSEKHIKNLKEQERLSSLLSNKQVVKEPKPEMPTFAEDNFSMPETEALDDILLGDKNEYLKLSAQQELDIWYDKEIEKVSIFENSQEMLLALSQAYDQRRNDLEQESLEKKKQFEAAKAETEINAVTQSLGMTANLFGKQTAAYKALSISQTLIETYKAATAAFAPPPVGAGPLFGGILAATTIATGLANVAKISATDTSMKGFAKGGTVVGENGIEIIAPMQDYAQGWAQVVTQTKMAVENSLRNNVYSFNDLAIVKEIRVLADAIKQRPNQIVFDKYSAERLTSIGLAELSSGAF